MSDILSFQGVDAFYDQAHILHDMTFNVPERGSVAIIGRNGVGKTTTVKTLLGMTRISRGRIAVAGQPMNHIRPYSAARLGISVVIQGRGIFPNLTVRENLLLGAAANRAGP